MESVFIWLIAISIVSALMFYANIYVYVFIERPQFRWVDEIIIIITIKMRQKWSLIPFARSLHTLRSS